jgi:hypothetical protein
MSTDRQPRSALLATAIFFAVLSAGAVTYLMLLARDPASRIIGGAGTAAVGAFGTTYLWQILSRSTEGAKSNSNAESFHLPLGRPTENTRSKDRHIVAVATCSLVYASSLIPYALLTKG